MKRTPTFDDFWRVYPLKKGKEDTEKKWLEKQGNTALVYVRCGGKQPLAKERRKANDYGH